MIEQTALRLGVAMTMIDAMYPRWELCCHDIASRGAAPQKFYVLRVATGKAGKRMFEVGGGSSPLLALEQFIASLPNPAKLIC